MPLEGFQIPIVVRSFDNEPKIFMLDRFLLKELVDLPPTAPMLRRWSVKIRWVYTQFEYELAEVRRRDGPKSSKKVSVSDSGYLSEPHAEGQPTKSCCLCKMEVRELSGSCGRKLESRICHIQ